MCSPSPGDKEQAIKNTLELRAVEEVENVDYIRDLHQNLYVNQWCQNRNQIVT